MLDRLILRISGASKAILCDAALSVAFAALTIGIAFGLSHAIVGVWNGEGISSGIGWIAIFVICFIGRSFVSFITDRQARAFAESASAKLRLGYMDSLFKLGPIGLGEGSTSVAVESVIGMDNISKYLISVLPKTTDIIMIPAVLFVAILSQDILSGVIVALCYPFIILFMKLIGHSASDDASRRHDGFKRMSEHFVDSLRGISTLKVFGVDEGYADKVHTASESYRRMTMRTLRIATLSGAVLDIFATCALAAVAIMLGFRMVDLDVAFINALIVLILVPEFFRPIKAFASDYHSSLEGKASLAQVFSSIDQAKEAVSSSYERQSVENAIAVKEAIARWGRSCRNASVAFSEDDDAIEFRDIEFKYKDGLSALKGIDFKVRYGQWVAIVGRSGEGKTTLASLIAGLISPTNGVIRIGGQDVLTLDRDEWKKRVAYIPQDPYIFHSTLRENVAFYANDVSDERIMSVMSMLGMDDAIASLPLGLDTFLGDGGLGLSGGQLQRIALARALLDEKRDIWVLDEPTSHLDIETEYDLNRTMLPLMEGKTVFIVTHRLHWIDDCDIVLRIDGGSIASMDVRNHLRIKPERNHDICDARSESCNDPDTIIDQVDSSGSSKDASAWIKSMVDSSCDSHGLSILKGLSWIILEHKGMFALAIMLGLVANIFSAALMFTSGFMISLAAAIPATVLALHIPSLFVRLFGIGKPIVAYVDRLESHDWILRITSKLRSDLFRFADIASSAGNTAKPSIGNALSIFTRSIEAAQEMLIRGVIPLISMFLTFVVVIALAVVFSIRLALVMAFLLSIVVIVMPIMSAKQESADMDQQEKLRADLLAQVDDGVYGLRDWILSGRKSDLVDLGKNASDAIGRIECASSSRARIRRLVFDTVFCLLILVMLLWSASSFTDPSHPFATDALIWLSSVTAPDSEPYPANWIAAFVLCLIPLAEVFSRASESAIEVERNKDAFGVIVGIERILDVSFEKRDAQTSLESAARRFKPYDIDAVTFSDVGFAYAGSSSKMMSFHVGIHKGEHVAILGQSAAGKSTFLKLVSGQIAACEGEILVFGKRVSDLHGKAPDEVVLIEQDPYIFNQSIKENLLIGKPEATDAEIECALVKVDLEEMVRRHRSVEEVMDESGKNISGGEKTRLALARALLSDASIVCMDEPFSALDPESEDAILDTLFNEFADRTLMVATHHLRGIERFDRVLFIEDGRIVLDGNPDRLLHESPYFASLMGFEKGRKMADQTSCLG